MKYVERILIGKNEVARIIRSGFKNKKHLTFFTQESEPIQVAKHSYSHKRDGRIQYYSLSKPIQITNVHKFIYIQEGRAIITLFNNPKNKNIKKIIKKGDSVIIKDFPHRVDFGQNTQALEFKQGPYENDLII